MYESVEHLRNSSFFSSPLCSPRRIQSAVDSPGQLLCSVVEKSEEENQDASGMFFFFFLNCLIHKLVTLATAELTKLHVQVLLKLSRYSSCR